MRTTIDAAGRVVVPKPFRDALGLEGGTEIEISLADDRIEIEALPTPMRLEQAEHGVVAVTDREMPALTADTVRETLERVRR